MKSILKDSRDKNEILECFKNVSNLHNYLQRQQTNFSSYMDYFNACKQLQLDMADTKNCMPKDFKQWHDIRIDEYATLRAKKDAELRKDLYMNFDKVAKKYLALQRSLKEDYIVIIAKTPNELVIEGERLHHCVGRMNYDQKFIREESLIFFVRDKQTPDTPFVTMEYSLRFKKVLQCYGDSDTRPSNEILEFVNKKWLPYANRKLNKIQKTLQKSVA